MASFDLTTQQVQDFQENGAVFLPGLLEDWIPQMEVGIERNLADPSDLAAESVPDEQDGRFFDDYCNWQRIDEFKEVIERSELPRVAAGLMKSETAQIFHEHVLVKFPGTSLATPWHSDQPYYFVDGEQTVSFWSPVDPVDEATLRFVIGSHRWEKPVLPVSWANNSNFYETGEFMTPPDPDAPDVGLEVSEWAMQPGDAVAFSFSTMHGARSNLSDTNRRAFSTRWVGDDVRYIERPGKTSPPFHGHGMVTGDRLRTDWFPVLHP